MARITITIDTDSAAFGPDPAAEVARILRKYVIVPGTDALDRTGTTLVLDANGNTVGNVTVTEDDEDDDYDLRFCENEGCDYSEPATEERGAIEPLSGECGDCINHHMANYT